jgi:hypothetical protein
VQGHPASLKQTARIQQAAHAAASSAIPHRIAEIFTHHFQRRVVMKQLFKALGALCLALVVSAQAHAQSNADNKVWGQVANFYHNSNMSNHRPVNGTVNGGNYAMAYSDGPLQRPECARSERFSVILTVFDHAIKSSISKNLFYTPGCDTTSGYYGDAELWMGLYYYNTANGQFDILVASDYTPLRLDTTFGAAWDAKLTLNFKTTMPPGRYRALVWARQFGVTDWQWTVIDFDANDDNLARGQIDYHMDRCANPLGPDCGISPRYVVAGWACDSPMYSGALDTSKLKLHKNASVYGDDNHPKYALNVYPRPDVVAAGLCSNNAVGFSYEYDGAWHNPSAGIFDTYTLYYANIELRGKQEPEGLTSNLPRGTIDYHVDRCGNPLGPDCGISPRYVVAGWACHASVYGGGLDTSKLFVDYDPYGMSFLMNGQQKHNMTVYPRPDVVAAGLCSENAVGFSYEYDGNWSFWTRPYKFYYANVLLSGKQVPDGITM